MKRYLAIFFICGPLLSISQQKDALLWSGIGLDCEMAKDFQLKFETQVRLDKNFMRFKHYYAEIEGEYELFDDFEVGLIYRYSRKNDGDFFYNENRFALDVTYKFKTDIGLDFRPRARLQHAFDRFQMVNEIYPDRSTVFRLAIKIDYEHDDFKLIQPFVSGEVFHALNPKNEITALDSYRMRGGLTFDLPDRHEIQVFYMYEVENRSSINHNHIYGLQYSYSLRDLDKWGKKGKDKDKSKD